MFVDLSRKSLITSYLVEGSIYNHWILLSNLTFKIYCLFTAKKQPLKTFSDIKGLIQQGKKREVKLMIRETAWPVNSTIRVQLWPELCAQHHNGKNMLDGFYWDMVNQVRCQWPANSFRFNFWTNRQVFGTTELPEKPIMLPPFVDSSHCLPYHLTKKGRAVADRVVSVLGYACPDITYSPSLYPITAILLHFMSGKSNRLRETWSLVSRTIKTKHETINRWAVYLKVTPQQVLQRKIKSHIAYRYRMSRLINRPIFAPMRQKSNWRIIQVNKIHLKVNNVYIFHFLESAIYFVYVKNFRLNKTALF